MKTHRQLKTKVVVLEIVLLALAGTMGEAQKGAPAIFGQEGAQNPSSTQGAYNRVSVKVMDQSGASVPGAHIAMLDQALGAIHQKEADASGQAEFVLARGAEYRATITTRGFKTYVESFRLEADTARVVTLKIENSCSGLCETEFEPVEIPMDYFVPLEVEIPQQPLRLLPLPARPIRRGHRRSLRGGGHGSPFR